MLNSRLPAGIRAGLTQSLKSCTWPHIWFRWLAYFLKKKKKQLNWDTLFSQLALGHWPKCTLTCILHLLGGCPALEGTKHGARQPSPWHQATGQAGTQKSKPKDNRSLPARSTELGKCCQDYKYFTLESELINRSNPSFQLSTFGCGGTSLCWPGFGGTPLWARAQKVKFPFVERERRIYPPSANSLMVTLPTQKTKLGLVPSRWGQNWASP